jgi:flagellar hook-basal body complex protein FliE
MGVDDGPPSWLRDYETIEVDLKGLTDFARSVDGAVDRNFAPRTGDLQNLYGCGVRFGFGNPSGNVRAAALKYSDALEMIARQIAAYIEASKILAHAARKAAERYSSADAMSAAQSQDVEKLLGQAIDDARARQVAVDAAAAAASRGDRQRRVT